MLVFSLTMITLGAYGILNALSSSVLNLIFRSIGLLLSIGDFKFYKNPRTHRNAWLVSHIGKMAGALIASITAFLIAGLGLAHLMTWILPSILGTYYIVYWSIKMKPKKKPSTV